MALALTIAEKILYHLSIYTKAEERYEVSFDITQDGIAQSCGISRAHAAIELKKLRESDFILEKLSHVKRAKSRRKVYFLTKDGKGRAAKIVEHVKSGAVDAGVDPSRISQGTGPAKRMKRYRTAIPNPNPFFGRDGELELLRDISEDDAISLTLITGLSGMGKTALLAKFARESKSSIFWFPFNEWETEISLLKTLADFLDETGEVKLSNYLKSDRVDLGEIGFLLNEAFSENRRILVFDDIDLAPRLHPMTKMIIENIGPNKIFMTAKSRAEFIDSLSQLHGNIREIMIGGLDIDASIELLASRGIGEEAADSLHRLTGGHPLMMRLMPANDEPSAKLELSNFVKKTFLKELSTSDMILVEKCSVFRKPFLSNFLSRDERHVLGLPIFYEVSGNFTMHEMIRRIVIDQIPESDKALFHSRAADFFLGEKNWSERLYHLIEAMRFSEAERLIHYRLDDVIAQESPGNMLNEISKMPPTLSRYSSSVRLLEAKVSAELGKKKDAIERLMNIVEEGEGDDRATALIQLSKMPLNEKESAALETDLENLLDDETLSDSVRSEAGLSLALLKYEKREIEESECVAKKALILAGNDFSLTTISSLNRLMAEIFVSRGDYSNAITHLSQTAQNFDGPYRSLYHRLFARSLSGLNQKEDAVRSLERSIAISEGNGQYNELAESLIELCNAKLANEDLDGAAESCYRCIEVSSSLGDKCVLAAAYDHLSSVEVKRGNEDEAEENRKIANELLSGDEVIAAIDLNWRDFANIGK